MSVQGNPCSPQRLTQISAILWSLIILNSLFFRSMGHVWIIILQNAIRWNIQPIMPVYHSEVQRNVMRCVFFIWHFCTGTMQEVD